MKGLHMQAAESVKWGAIRRAKRSSSSRSIMTDLSRAANFAWQVAAQEAAAAKFEFIEPEHILIGICSLEKLDESKIDPAEKVGFLAEKAAIELRLNGLDPTQVRRSLRMELGEGHYARTEHTVHRSPACKQVFERAAKLGSIR